MYEVYLPFVEKRQLSGKRERAQTIATIEVSHFLGKSANRQLQVHGGQESARQQHGTTHIYL
jgi:hypothetical protein